MTSPHTPSTGAPVAAAEFDALFRSEHDGGGFARIAQLVDPTLPEEIEPFSFLCTDLLHHITEGLALNHGDVLADLGCGRGGPGLWLARTSGATLVGIDFSPVAITHARRRACAFGMAHRARFLTSDLAATGLPAGIALAAVAIDALSYAPDPGAAASEARRILRPGGRLVLTGWHPKRHGDPRLPERHRSTDWPAVLDHAGFTTIECQTRTVWDDAYRWIYRAALHAGDPGPDAALAGLQGEARRRLPTAHLLSRVAVTATAL